jgi:hypothetical protein
MVTNSPDRGAEQFADVCNLCRDVCQVWVDLDTAGFGNGLASQRPFPA